MNWTPACRTLTVLIAIYTTATPTAAAFGSVLWCLPAAASTRCFLPHRVTTTHALPARFCAYTRYGFTFLPTFRCGSHYALPVPRTLPSVVTVHLDGCNSTDPLHHTTPDGLRTHAPYRLPAGYTPPTDLPTHLPARAPRYRYAIRLPACCHLFRFYTRTACTLRLVPALLCPSGFLTAHTPAHQPLPLLPRAATPYNTPRLRTTHYTCCTRDCYARSGSSTATAHRLPLPRYHTCAVLHTCLPTAYATAYCGSCCHFLSRSFSFFSHRHLTHRCACCGAAGFTAVGLSTVFSPVALSLPPCACAGRFLLPPHHATAVTPTTCTLTGSRCDTRFRTTHHLPPAHQLPDLRRPSTHRYAPLRSGRYGLDCYRLLPTSLPPRYALFTTHHYTHLHRLRFWDYCCRFRLGFALHYTHHHTALRYAHTYAAVVCRLPHTLPGGVHYTVYRFYGRLRLHTHTPPAAVPPFHAYYAAFYYRTGWFYYIPGLATRRLPRTAFSTTAFR